MAAVVDVSDQTFESAVLRSETPVLVDFWAPWCGPCRAISPAVEDLAGEYQGKMAFTKLNADDNPRTMMKYGVMGLPTLLLFRDGNEVARLVGARPKAAIKRTIDEVIGG